MKKFDLAIIAGDGIGPEVVAEGLKVLDKVASKHSLTFNKIPYNLGAAQWHATGEVLNDDTMAKIAKADVMPLALASEFKEKDADSVVFNIKLSSILDVK